MIAHDNTHTICRKVHTLYSQLICLVTWLIGYLIHVPFFVFCHVYFLSSRRARCQYRLSNVQILGSTRVYSRDIGRQGECSLSPLSGGSGCLDVILNTCKRCCVSIHHYNHNRQVPMAYSHRTYYSANIYVWYYINISSI